MLFIVFLDVIGTAAAAILFGRNGELAIALRVQPGLDAGTPKWLHAPLTDQSLTCFTTATSKLNSDAD
jgi:hypothetical protein